MGILLNSNMLGPLIGCYLFLFLILFVSFVNIYSVDKYEFQNVGTELTEFIWNDFCYFVSIVHTKWNCKISNYKSNTGSHL